MPILEPDIVDPHPDRERLVYNDSEHSFQSKYSEDNQITITRHINEEKYSTMCFKPVDNNMVDVTITNGEYRHNKHALAYGHFTSQDIRQRYIGKAKFGVVIVFTLIFIMLAVLLYCLLMTPAHFEDSSQEGIIALSSKNETIRNTEAFPEAYVVNSTDAFNIQNASTTNA